MVREEQLQTRRELTDALSRIAKLERLVEQLLEKDHKDDNDHTVSSG